MNKRDELISVLLDGECCPEELEQVVDACEESAALRERYSRWCLVREAMQGTRVVRSSEQFCASVMAGLDQPATSVVRHPARLQTRRRWRPAAGLALAASLGALFTVGVTHWTGGTAGVPARTASAQTGNAAVAVAAVAPTAQPVAAVQEMQWGQLDADSARKLDDYVLEHSSDRADAVLGGDAIGYARMAARAGYDSGNGPR